MTTLRVASQLLVVAVSLGMTAQSDYSVGRRGREDHPRLPGHRCRDLHRGRRGEGHLEVPALLPRRLGAGRTATSCWPSPRARHYPGGAVVEVTRDGKVVFEFKGTQSEVNTVQPLDERQRPAHRGRATSRGCSKWIAKGKVVVEVPLQAQTKDHHLQTRMARKLANGNYLVPQLLDKVVREYDAEGQGRLGGEDAAHAVHRDPARRTATR